MQRLRTRTGVLAGLPAAIMGSIAFSLVGSPAAAAAPEARAETRPLGLKVMSAPPATYTVTHGDTVSAIAARYGLRTSDVLRWNDLSWSSIIRPGQVLKLKASAAPAKPATATKTTTTTKTVALTHVVKAGDTVSAIAKRHGVSVQKVLDANKLTWSSFIYPGQKLTIPGKTTTTTVKTTTGSTTKTTATSKPASTTKATTHTVRAGDTITAIAAKYGTTVNAVLQANKLSRSSIIYPGQKITIPGSSGGSSTGSGSPASVSKKTVKLDAEQAKNAKRIIAIGRELGVPERGIAIALATAMQESWIRNLDWGDRDSLGLFQQRPSSGWGTASQIRNVDRSIRVFYGGPKDPNGSRTRGLLDIPGWQRMSLTQAAQAVQISAYPDRYAQWEDDAYAWLATHG